jgi:O-antigen/teichoic acid export membrane protein
VLNKVLGIVLLPIYTRFLSPADYGLLALLLLSGNIVLVVIQGGLGPAAFREALYQRTDEDVTLGTAMRQLVLQGMLVCVALLVCARPIAGTLLGSVEHAPVLRLVFVTSLLQSIETLGLARFRMRRQAGGYAALVSAKFVMGAVLNILFVAVLRRGVGGLIEATLLTSAVFAASYAFVLRGAISTSWSTRVLQRLVAFGLPLVGVGLAAVAMMAIDRYLLQLLATTRDVGLYSLGYSIGLAVSLIVQPVQLAWPAEALTLARTDGGPRTIARLVRYYLVAVGFVALAVGLFAKEILLVLATPEFFAAATVVPVIAASHLLNGMRMMTTIGLTVSSRTGYAAAVMLIVLAANALLNLEMIPRWGIMGAAGATLASYTLQLAMTWVISVRVWHVPYEYGRLFRIGLAIAVLWLAGWWVPTETVWGGVIAKSALMAAFPALLLAFRVFDRTELREASAVLRVLP